MGRPVPRRAFAAAALLAALAGALLATAAPSREADAGRLPPGVARAGEGFVSTRDGMGLVFVPGGEAEMGSEEGAYDERPTHRVRLRAFWIDRHEVTNAQFARFAEESGYAPRGPWRRGAGAGRERHPVRFVTWHDAAAYARWAGRRLPTEAEWERAARSADALRYPWGEDWAEGRACTDRSVGDGPVPVGSFPAGRSPCGALDLAGSVWEWTADWYDRYAYEARAGHVVEDPTGPADGTPPEPRFLSTRTGAGNERSTRKVVRGGGWATPGREGARASKRGAANPSYWLDDTGFRCAVSAP